MTAFEWSANVTRDTGQFVTVVRENKKHEKVENTKTEREEIWRESKRNRVSCFNIFVLIYLCLLFYRAPQKCIDTRSKMKSLFLEYFSFAMSDCYDFYESVYEKFSIITLKHSFDNFSLFYQISNKCYCLLFCIDLFSWTIISSGSQEHKVRTNLEVP